MAKFRFRAWPTEVRRITQHFGARPEVYAAFGFAGHEGMDFAAPVGSKVLCVANGAVQHVFPDDGRPYGINVRVRHAEGYETIYAHLQEATVAEGQRVRAGQVVGLAGLTGNTEGPHLHLSLKQEDANLPGYPNHFVDPTPFVDALLDANWVDATFVRDLVPDGTVFQPAKPFTQTWFLHNSGNRTWRPGDVLAHVAGPALGAPSSLPLPWLPPGAEAPITVQLQAPLEPGRHRSLWQPCSAEGEFFGEPVWVEIEVPEPQLVGRGVRGFFVQPAGQGFSVQGRPFRFFGFNLRGLAHYGRRAEDPLKFSRPEHQLSQLQAVYDLGARVVRIFLADRFVGRDEIQARLRTLLELVDRHFPDLYLLPAFTNLYHDVPFQHPGDAEEWLFSGPLLSRDFFAGRFRENYLPFVTEIVTAFRDDANIFAWEIGNELKLDRANLGDPNDPNPWLFVRFNLETAAAIKRCDPNHMVTTGMKATHHAWLHSTALQEELYRSPNIDFVTIHSYEGKWDRDGDMRVYDDAALAARCNKPFVVEEAGFDRELFPDRVAKHREHIDRWLGLGAQGYMPWGFSHAHAIGDSDDSVGISSDHGDFQALCDLFRTYAAQLNAASRGMVRPFLPPPAPGRVRIKDKLGVDANRPIDPATGTIAPQVDDPGVIGDLGLGWVRLNFVLGETWTGPEDPNRPRGRTWVETYQQIIANFRGRDLRVYGLIGAEAMRDNPGDQFRDAIGGPVANDWIQRYVTTFVQIVERFHGEVELFESFNEPDDWHGSNRNWLHPTWFALLLQEVHQAVRSRPALAHVKLVSGPLQGLDNNDNAGAEYLRQAYEAGQRFFGWGQPGVPFPFDAVGYHLYIAQNPANPGQEIRAMYDRYMNRVREVIRAAEGADKPIYLSEVGWQSHIGDDRHAECMGIGLQAALDDPSVALGIWFCTQDFGEQWGIYRAGSLTPDQRKPAYFALQALCARPDTAPTPVTIAEIAVAGFDDAQYVRDLVVDGSVWQPGQEFIQTWTLRNTGSRPWQAGYRLVCIAGENLGAPAAVAVPACPPGGEASITVQMRASQAAGFYESFWKMINPQDELFGERVWVKINVEAARAVGPFVFPLDKSALELDRELALAWRSVARHGFATTERVMTRLDATLDGSVLQPESETLALAALSITYHAYWAQLAALTPGENGRLIVQEAAQQALTSLGTLLAHQQARGGGSVAPQPPAPPTAPPGSGSANRRRALCIGIDRYAVQPLAGCVADARLWAETLANLGFETPKLLLDGEATRAGIYAAVQELVQTSRAGDIVVVQYAGHGTQLPDLNGDEQGGDSAEYDEAFVPVDFTQGAYLIDDDLGALFSQIPAGVNVTCFFDCCHSGTISRAPANERPRFIVADPAMKSAHRRYREQMGASRALPKRTPESMREVVFSACQSTEVAWESNGHGEFTLRATGELRAGAGALSHEAFIQRVLAAFGATPRQQPLLDCAPAMRNGRLLAALVE